MAEVWGDEVGPAAGREVGVSVVPEVGVTSCAWGAGGLVLAMVTCG